jgi:hypothetical protein
MGLANSTAPLLSILEESRRKGEIICSGLWIPRSRKCLQGGTGLGWQECQPPACKLKKLQNFFGHQMVRIDFQVPGGG